jgi:hypothetical protein
VGETGFKEGGRTILALLAACLTLVSFFTYPSTLKMEATHSSETSVGSQRTTRNYFQ